MQEFEQSWELSIVLREGRGKGTSGGEGKEREVEREEDDEI